MLDQTIKSASTRHVYDLLPPDLCCAESIDVPSWAFLPDQWSIAFLRGLKEASKNWSHKKVWEVGVGTGINILCLRGQVRNVTWYYSDVDDRCVPLANENLGVSVDGTATYQPLYGSWDLVCPPVGAQRPHVDIIFGCLPQVPLHADLSLADRHAHYYDPEAYRDSHLHVYGLGLNEALLTRAREVLRPKGKVILNLGGRPGREKLELLFKEAHYSSRVLHEAIVRQHSATSLESLAHLEEEVSASFEFFTDKEAANCIGAIEAERRRLDELPVYHKIYVFEGSLLP